MRAFDASKSSVMSIQFVQRHSPLHLVISLVTSLVHYVVVMIILLLIKMLYLRRALEELATIKMLYLRYALDELATMKSMMISEAPVLNLQWLSVVTTWLSEKTKQVWDQQRLTEAPLLRRFQVPIIHAHRQSRVPIQVVVHVKVTLRLFQIATFHVHQQNCVRSQVVIHASLMWGAIGRQSGHAKLCVVGAAAARRIYPTALLATLRCLG